MKKNIRNIAMVFLVLSVALTAEAQSRKHISNFSHFQSYFNPALTGYEGSTIRGFVRNQWSGFEGAPKTYFISAELDFGELAGEEDPALMGKNAVSANMLYDTYGAFRETELLLSYASRVRLTERHNLRLGVGLNYQSIRLDGNSLTTEEQNDPTLGQYIGQFSNMNVVDFNLGIALTHAKYYVSYGMHRVAGGKITSGDEFMDGYPTAIMVQAGYRESISENLGVIFNAFYRSQKDIKDNLEFNLKALLMDRVWVGMGHRINYATNAQLGILTNRLRIGYLYEFSTGGAYNLPGNTHEFTAVFNLFRDNNRRSDNQVLIW
ncbi:type IX secretion system membrane protein PorP/SprF [Algoriphagus lutimaris]|uniref:PorP/SprF family type IX secretion system membrane protein n=1 Tax=Algoriphagus lutimaris TaxID=613197 RepID=UPI00196B3C2A|nr:type IX secretion system membrane protein PorP/SprF [Algoriphagus lutimaris]MBN3518965.1 type IX secretion system membrane protein PorP/SprF [Algoriphagus lutimaris]